ncbi:MAG: hypothetical protein IPO31_23465 [Candidatus Obscuribacter sp.]|nr:hypothetical protein [Candidatus Obscuribacter sp.]
MDGATGGRLANWCSVSCYRCPGASGIARWQDESRPAQVDQEYEIEAVLHFTTWTFQPGHKMRISVANAQVPMTWPAPIT